MCYSTKTQTFSPTKHTLNKLVPEHTRFLVEGFLFSLKCETVSAFTPQQMLRGIGYWRASCVAALHTELDRLCSSLRY